MRTKLILSFFLFCLCFSFFLYFSHASYQNFSQTVTYQRLDYSCGAEYVSFEQATYEGNYDGFLTFYGYSTGNIPVQINDGGVSSCELEIVDYEGLDYVLFLNDDNAGSRGYFDVNTTYQLLNGETTYFIMFWLYTDYYGTNGNLFTVLNATGDMIIEILWKTTGDCQIWTEDYGWEVLDRDPPDNTWICYHLILQQSQWVAYWYEEDTELNMFEDFFSISGMGGTDFEYCYDQVLGNNSALTCRFYADNGVGDLYIDSIDFSNAPLFYVDEVLNPLYCIRPRYLALLGGAGIGHIDQFELYIPSLFIQNSTFQNASILSIQYRAYITLTGLVILNLLQFYNWNISKWESDYDYSFVYQPFSNSFNSSDNRIKVRIIALFSNYTVEALISYQVSFLITWKAFYSHITDLDLTFLILTQSLPFLFVSLVVSLVFYDKLGGKRDIFFFAFMIMSFVGVVAGMIPPALAVLIGIVCVASLIILNRKVGG